MLAADGIDAEVINIHTIKPIDRELIVKSVSKTGKAVTVEEHSINEDSEVLWQRYSVRSSLQSFCVSV